MLNVWRQKHEQGINTGTKEVKQKTLKQSITHYIKLMQILIL